LNRPQTLTTEAGRNISIRFEYELGSIFNWNTDDRLYLRVGCARAEKITSSCNGAMVYLDKALTIPTKTVYDLLKSKPDFSEFVSLIDAAGLSDGFKSDQFDATVLAPTNQALSNAIEAEEKRHLMASPQRLRRFVKEQVILGSKCCHELSGNDDWFSGTRFTTMAGTQLTTTGRDEGRLRVGGARVKQCDLEATNGLVHAIEGVVTSRRRWRWPTFGSHQDDQFDDFGF